MRKCLGILWTVAVIALSWLITSDVLSQGEKVIIRVRGSESVAGRVDKLSKIYMKDHPEVLITVSGGGNTIGINSLRDQSGEVAMAGRKITDPERSECSANGVEVVERLIGYGGIAFVVDPDNPQEEVSVDQLQKILKGDFNNWNQVGGANEPIRVFTIGEHHAGTVQFMETDFLAQSKIASKAQVVSTFDSVIRQVAATKGAIGFTRLRDALESPVAQKVRIKILKVKSKPDATAIFPSRAAVADGSYPIKRPFFLYYDAKVNPEVKSFIEFVVGKGWGAQSP
jgi:phosphate transport system substrate-binding protein